MQSSVRMIVESKPLSVFVDVPVFLLHALASSIQDLQCHVALTALTVLLLC